MQTSPSPLDPSARVSASGSDPDLFALPPPPRRTRTVSLAVMAFAALLSLAMIWVLRGEVRYALAPSSPTQLGDLSRLRPGSDHADAFVHGTGRLSSDAPIEYRRFLEPDAFRVAPLVGNDTLWVELRLPSETSASAAPQSSFVGRLVPLSSAGLQYRELAARIAERAPARADAEVWLLVEGATPASSRWAMGLALALGLFTAWSLAQIVRLLRPARE